MRSPAVYGALREAWSATLTETGFQRIPGNRSAAWYRPENGENLLFHVTVDQHGWDPHHGSNFVAEFELASRLVPGTVVDWDRRSRLGQNFDAEAVRAVLDQQNAVIAKLPKPRVEQLPPDEADAAFYLREFFEPVTEVHPHDLHFRYLDERDVGEWAALLRPMLADEATKFLAQSRGGQ